MQFFCISYSATLLLIFSQIPTTLTGFLGSVRAQVESGTSACFNVTTSGYLYVHLLSESGDCDLYASTTNEQPDFDDYTVQSTTCGVDWLIIPKRYPRPVYIAMYGHPSHNLSKCSMSFCEIDVNTPTDDYMDEMTEQSLLQEYLQSSCEVPDSKKTHTPRALHFLVELILEVILEVLGS